MATKQIKHPYRKYIWLLWFMFFAPIVALVVMLSLVGNGVFGKLPDFKDLENPDLSLASEVVSQDGMVLGKYFIQNRSNVHFRDLSINLTKALKATEDARFYEHSGIDIKGLMRVLVKTIILRQDAGGGSTITQQLAKNLFPRTRNHGFALVTQKMKEWITATRLERNYTKEEIISMYFNTVEFGNNAYGIKSAARTYFDKTPDKLNMLEASLLVGMLKGPTLYNPVKHNKRATNRRNTVLEQQLKYDYIDQTQFDSLRKQPIKLKFALDDHNIGLGTYFRESLRQDLMKWCNEHKKPDGTTYNLYRDGLRIYTTIDSRMQKCAEDAVKEHLTDLQKSFNDHWKGREPWYENPEIISDAMHRCERWKSLAEDGKTDKEIEKIFKQKTDMTIFTWKGEKDTLMSPLDSIKYYKKFLQTGFMAIDPATGHIKAWVGGNDYRYFKYDHVKEGKRQVGSTFKPFLYTLAMQESYSPCYKVPNELVTIRTETGEDWTPQNSDSKYGGMISLKDALANSVNTVSAYLMKQFGPKPVIEMARKMGITSQLDAVPAIALGAADISVYEMVGAYATFANKGVYTEPIYITRIEDKSGVVIQEFIPKKIEAISEETAYLMLNLMQGVVAQGGGTGARLRTRYNLTNPIAGKTGTTQNNSDGWFMGVVPNLVAGCWVGAEDRAVRFRSTSLGQGANMALPIWALFFKKCYAIPELGISISDFEKPKGPLGVELDCSKYTNDKSQGEKPEEFGVQ
nr:penicillin-binding protein [Bacteroidota bacterium]